MARKLERPPTMAERMYQWSFGGWENSIDAVAVPGAAGHQQTLKALRGWVDPRMDRFRDRLVRARRFAITPSMADVAFVNADMMLRVGCLIDLADTARLPYPVMWLNFTEDNEVNNVSYLLWRNLSEDDTTNWMCTICVTQHDGSVTISPTAIAVGPAQVTPRAYAITDVDRRLNARLWGVRDTNDVPDTVIKALMHRAAVVVDPYILYPIVSNLPHMREQALPLMVNAAENMVGFIVAILKVVALIDSPHVTLDLRVTKGFYQHRLRNMPYLTSTTVTVNCAPHVLTKYINDKVAEHMRARHRAHEVRGFWRHYLNDARCDPSNHDWTPDVEDTDLHHCARCAGRRRWIKEHTRGDASLGWINHQYVATYEEERK